MTDESPETQPPDLTPSKDQLAQSGDLPVKADYSFMGIPRGEIGQYHLSEAVRAIAESGIKGQSAMVLLLAFTNRLESDLLGERESNKQLRNDLQELSEKYYSAAEMAARLRERLTSARSIRLIQNALLTIGTLSFGNGLRLMLDGITGTSIAFALVGMLGLLCGWLWPAGRSKGTDI